MVSIDEVRGLIGGTAYASDGDKLGKIGQVFLDDQTGEPEWATVSTGMFGGRESFVPLAQANVSGDGLTLPYSKDQVKDAPNVDVDQGHLSQEEEGELYRHYGLDYSEAESSEAESSEAESSEAESDSGLPTGETTDYSTTGETADYSTTDRGVVGNDTSGPETDDAMTRSEEQVRVGTEKVQTGRARLRKWVETENVNVSVPVTRERARLETEPITDTNRDEALSGGDLTEEEHEVILTEERPVVQKETVPVERVRLTKDVEQTEETVSDEVRKERVAAEGDVPGDASRDRDI